MKRLIVSSVLVIAFELLATISLAQKPNPVRPFSGAVVCDRCNLRGIDLKSHNLSRANLIISDLTRAILTQVNIINADLIYYKLIEEIERYSIVQKPLSYHSFFY